MENKEIGINYPKRISGLVSLALLLLFFGALVRISSDDNWSRINWQRFWVYTTVTGLGGVGFLIYAIYPKSSEHDKLNKIIKGLESGKLQWFVSNLENGKYVVVVVKPKSVENDEDGQLVDREIVSKLFSQDVIENRSFVKKIFYKMFSIKVKDIPVYTNNGYMYERGGGLVYVKASETTHQQMQKNPNSGAWVSCGREEGFDPEEVVLRLSIP